MSKIVSEEVQELIKNNVPGQLSAFRILDITASVDGMDEQMYKALPEEKKREIEEQNKKVENEEDLDKLYNMLRKGYSPRTVAIISGKLMKHKEEIMSRLIEDLKRSGNDNFVETAARLLIRSEDNYAKEIADILPQIKYPYTQAVACYVLGKVGNEEHIETLYNYFNTFKKNYKNETYYEGPLLGLHELKRRYEF